MSKHYISRFLKAPKKESFFLFGPRGTGKSTWIKHAFSNILVINLLDPNEERRYASMPERLRETLSLAQHHSKICVIDEVQRVPTILPIVHALIEEGKDIQFILTGSSARKLRRSSSDLLGGRALLRHMQPFLASELGKEFSLEKALQIGLIPLIWESENPLDKLQGYVSLYLREEVQAEGLVRQIGDFARFMEIMSFSHGSLINSTDISREAHVKRQTVDNYLGILQDLLLGYTLPVFAQKAKRAVISHSKFYFFDPGVFRTLRPQGPKDPEAELEGPALEGLVAQHLRTWVLNQTSKHQFAFWRTRTGLEVDFVIYGPRGFWAIEVKRSANLSPKDINGLLAFKEEYPDAQCFILYGGKHPILYRNILCLPVEDFLINLTPEKEIANIEGDFLH